MVISIAIILISITLVTLYKVGEDYWNWRNGR